MSTNKEYLVNNVFIVDSNNNRRIVPVKWLSHIPENYDESVILIECSPTRTVIHVKSKNQEEYSQIFAQLICNLSSESISVSSFKWDRWNNDFDAHSGRLIVDH